MNRTSERKWACSIKSLWRKEVCRASRWEVHMGSEQTPWHNHAGVLSVHSPRLPKEWITLSLEAQVTEAGYLIHSGSWRMTLRCHSEVLVGKKCHRHCDSQEVQERTGQGKLQKWKFFSLSPLRLPCERRCGLRRTFGLPALLLYFLVRAGTGFVEWGREEDTQRSGNWGKGISPQVRLYTVCEALGRLRGS